MKFKLVCVLFILFLIPWARAEECSPESKITRIVSLAPSNTEIIYALGAQDLLVGVSNVCDFPIEAKQKPKASSFVSVNFELLTHLRPQAVLLVNGQEAMASVIKSKGYKVILLKNENISDISKNIITVGNLVGKKIESEKIVQTFDSVILNLQKILSNNVNKNDPKVFFCVWLDPLITVGGNSFLNDAITKCGGANLAKNLAAAYPHYSLEKLFFKQPDIIIMPHEAKGQNFWKKSPWKKLNAIQKEHLYFYPKSEMNCLTRPSLRIVNGLYWLALTIHPEKESAINNWFKRAQLVSKF
jgi:iron complex transport system substrate-binding protein